MFRFLCLTVTLCLSAKAAKPCQPAHTGTSQCLYFSGVADLILHRQGYRNFTVTSVVKCSNLCMSDTRCLSINYSEWNKVCDLNGDSASQFPQSLTERTGSYYYGPEEPSVIKQLQRRVDRAPPVVTCPPDLPFEVTLGDAGRRVIWGLPTVTDNSESFFLVSSTFNLNDFFTVGSNTVTYTYRDAANNQASCSFTILITAVDRTPPVVTCPTDIPFEVTLGDTGREVTWDLPTVTDNSGSFFFVSSTFNPNDFFTVGSNTVTYTYRDAANNQASCRFTVLITAGSPMWPLGVYGLPMPTYGCPTRTDFTWATGSRFQDTEDTYPNNGRSYNLHLNGFWGISSFEQQFCIKLVHSVNNDDVEWPHGEYCVYQVGVNCPQNMSSGYVQWDDEDFSNTNKVSGTMPFGTFNADTLIYYCCMSNGLASNPINLPTHSPFYLFAFTAQCQEVQGMTVSGEFFEWDTENTDNMDETYGSFPHGIYGNSFMRIYYCYYVTI